MPVVETLCACAIVQLSNIAAVTKTNGRKDVIPLLPFRSACCSSTPFIPSICMSMMRQELPFTLGESKNSSAEAKV
jgi:hypothetical protein